MKAYCRIHKRFEEITGYERDNPILACGAVKLPNDRIDACREAIEKFVLVHALTNGISLEQSRQNLIRSLII